MKKIYHIAVEGTIGVGKTSLARILSEELQGRLILEEFESNPFLKDYYKDRKRWAFQTQINFLISRYYQQLRMQQVDLFADKIISDYMFAKDKLFAQTSLDDNEMILYKKLANIFEKNVTYPDLVVFLQSDVDKLIENIRKRGREYEKDIDWEYLSQLNEIYNQYFFRYDKGNLLVINANNIDFVNNKEDLNQILKVIRTPFTGIKFFNPQTLENNNV
ncbi:MAG: deoxynucleoside kinase [Candidatus Marinimicrobia bacterium]|nr:deoxynucleoside kinase [Candidatus Neomarinimicrobiota bacterium]|tara:strand:- start:3316 stop:3969 length:654 start_codon:yes stop_codon:yes gene_type:complete